jgi:hypothetical protein
MSGPTSIRHPNHHATRRKKKQNDRNGQYQKEQDGDRYAHLLAPKSAVKPFAKENEHRDIEYDKEPRDRKQRQDRHAEPRLGTIGSRHNVGHYDPHHAERGQHVQRFLRHIHVTADFLLDREVWCELALRPSYLAGRLEIRVRHLGQAVRAREQRVLRVIWEQESTIARGTNGLNAHGLAPFSDSQQ